MPSPAVHVRFVGLLSSPRAEALARACISGLDAMYGDVERWEVCLHPPLAPWCSSGYAVRAQARMADGGVISMRAQGAELEATVRDAFDGIEALLLQEARGSAGRRPAWLPTRSGDTQALPA
jgi:hypothetical protein